MADLLPGSGSDTSLSKLDPKVNSLARPATDWLLQARAEVQRDPVIRELFQEKGQTPEWLADQVASRLAGLWGGQLLEAVEVAKYLVDERVQLGEGIFLISSETGLVIAKLEESDLYTPTVPRVKINDEGQLVLGETQGLTRIQPGVEAMIVTHQFEKGREERILQQLTLRANQTALLREEGDRRLWVATRQGRARLAQALGENHPKRLLEDAGGTAGAFLQHFDLVTRPADGVEYDLYPVRMSSKLAVHNPLTTNLNYDRLGTLRGVFAQGWVRDLAAKMSRSHFYSAVPQGVDADEVTPEMLLSCDLWIATPEVMLHLLKVEPKVRVLPVDGAYTMGLQPGKIGTLVIPDAFNLGNREVFGRWEVSGSLELQLHIPDWTRVTTHDIRGLALHAEVVG